MTENELLEAIGKMMDEKLKPIQEDLEDLKEQAEIAITAANVLIEWAESVSKAYSFPLPRIGA